MNKSPKHFINRLRLRENATKTAFADIQETYQPRYQKTSLLSHRRATRRIQNWLPEKHT